MLIESIKINTKDNLRNALEKLNNSGLATLFVVDDQDILVGILTDGSIRRSLLQNVSLDSLVYEIMKTEFISFHIDTDNSKILAAINESVKIIPLVNDKKQLVDYSSITKIRRIAIAAPLLNGNELAYVTDCIKTNWISSQGKYVKQFENMFTDYHHGFYSLAVSNGTVALHLALIALGINEDHEVIVPNLTFAASVNSIIYTGAKPILIDVERESFNMDVDKIENAITTKTKAIMVVHLYGNPCKMNEILSIANKYNLYVIEDCAEALGSFYDGKPVGVFGDVSTFSFYGNKTITTGEGGMVLFKSEKIAQHAAILRDHGMSRTKRYWHEEVGYNYRITNIQAAIGVAQFERLDEFVSAKRKIALTYSEILSKHKFFLLPKVESCSINSYWLFTCVITSNAPFTRDELMNYLNNHGIETRPVFYPMSQMPPYAKDAQSISYEVSEEISTNGFSLPSSVNLTELELVYICNTINSFINTKL
jgi:perosamine synthetase